MARPSAEQIRLERLLAGMESRMRQAFQQFIAGVNSKAAQERVLQLLQARDIDGALGIVDSYTVRMANVLPTVVTTAATAEVQRLAVELAGITRGVAVSFNPGNPRAANIMSQNRLQFITEFSRAQREATRWALVNSLEAGDGIAETARAFRDSIGLTRMQEQAVANYRQLLEDGSSEALSRALRDRRFDPSVERAVEGDPLSADQIDTMVTRYRSRYLDYRAETIARTESQRAMSQGREEALQQTLEQADIGRDAVERVWHATRDNRTRDAHRAMDGQTVGMDEPFEDGDGNELMYPGDPDAPAETTINCRCVVSYRVK